MPQKLDVDLSRERSRRSPKVHRWWARRGDSTSVLSLLLTNAPELAFQKDELEQISLDPTSYKGTDLSDIKVLDLCCGSCEVSAAAARLGATTHAIDLHPIPILIGNAELLYPARHSEASKLAKGSGKDGKWAGLRYELDHWASELIARAKKTSSKYWLEGIRSLACHKTYKCESCLSIGPIRTRTDSASGGFSFQGQDSDLLCLSCGSILKGGTFSPYAYDISVNADDNNSGPNRHDSCNDLIPCQHEMAGKGGPGTRWASWGLGWLSHEEAVSPRQAIIQASFKSAYRSIRDELADIGYDPQSAKALLTYLALGISNKIDLLGTSCYEDAKTGRIKGNPALYWRRSGAYCEIGGDEFAEALRQQFALIQKVIESNKGLGSNITVSNEDMRQTNREPASIDLVLWDPPYYDNLNYDIVAYPWTRFLREMLGDIDSSLVWPNETDESSLQVLSSEDLHTDDLRKTLNEIARIIKPSGRVGVFWILESDQRSDRLAKLLDSANGCGLELIQTYSLTTETSIKYPQAILLILRPSIVAPHSANAIIVQEGTIKGKKMMHAGIVEILLANLPEDEIEDLIPPGYKGARDQRLSEAVLSSPNPRDLLLNISKSRLLSCMKAKDLRTDELPDFNKEEIANILMESLGWTLPRRAEFTIGAAIDDISRLRDELKLTKDEQDIRGVGAAAFDRIEQILRFCVVSWSTLLRDDEWLVIPREITGKNGKFSFGDWHRCIIELPTKYSSESPLIERARLLLKKSKIIQALEPVVGLRNSFSHHDAGRGDWHDLRDVLFEKLGVACDSLRKAYELNAFPLVLQPEREIRDQYGRITLRLIGHRSRPIEFLMTQHSQMSSPMVFIPSDTNPREVDPCRLMAPDVFSRAAI